MATRVDKLVVIVGPTASGKTAHALKLAEKSNGEIICADSRTIYREADIGTAKPNKLEQQRIRHHLLDVVNIGEPFSVAVFKRLADEAIADIRSRGKLPILVGGSGLYIDAVIYNYQFRTTIDSSIREQFKESTVEEIQAELIARGIALPENSQNKRYLIRSLEAGDQKVTNSTLRSGTSIIGIDIEQDELRNRSMIRSRQMVRDGVVQETEYLYQKYGEDPSVMKSPAYVAFRGVFSGVCTEAEAIERCIQLDLKLARKQRTWFRRNKHIQWVDPR